MKRWAGASWLAAALAVSLLALAVFLGQDRGDAATLEAAISAAEAGRGRAEAFERELRVHLDRQPRDARGWVIFARLQAERDRFDEAAQAYERAIALSSRVARDPAVWCEYADALGMARGGRLEGRPRELIDRALALDSRHPKALEMAGPLRCGARVLAAAARAAPARDAAPRRAGRGDRANRAPCGDAAGRRAAVILFNAGTMM